MLVICIVISMLPEHSSRHLLIDAVNGRIINVIDSLMTVLQKIIYLAAFDGCLFVRMKE